MSKAKRIRAKKSKQNKNLFKVYQFELENFKIIFLKDIQEKEPEKLIKLAQSALPNYRGSTVEDGLRILEQIIDWDYQFYVAYQNAKNQQEQFDAV